MAIEHRRISEKPTAAGQRHEAYGLTTQSGSLRHERFFLEGFFNRLGRPSIQMKLWDGFTVGAPDRSIGTVTFNNRSVLYQLLVLGEVAFGDRWSV